jgi:hypothetical protein
MAEAVQLADLRRDLVGGRIDVELSGVQGGFGPSSTVVSQRCLMGAQSRMHLPAHTNLGLFLLAQL